MKSYIEKSLVILMIIFAFSSNCYSSLVNNVYLPIYRKHFSEEEIKALIAFYSSPVGKKFSSLTPTLMQESSEIFNRLYGPKVQKLGGELMQKEIKELISKAKELKNDR